MENSKRLTGAIFSAPMFFKSNGEIDYISYENYITKCVKSEGVEVIYAMAYNTRFRQLSEEEIVKVSKITCDLANSFKKNAIIGHPYTITTKGLSTFCSIVSKFKPYAISVLYPERYYGMTKPLRDFFNIPKKHNIKVIFVAPQFSQKAAKIIAKSIGGVAVHINPLDENYAQNLIDIAKVIENSYK